MALSFLCKEALIELATIAGAAGDAVMKVYSSADSQTFRSKDDQSPLTEADLRSHELIYQALRSFAPDIPILSEESEWLHPGTQTYWAVDPLDGTKEFIRRNGEFTVNIALIVDAIPRLGVICAPAVRGFWMGLNPLNGEIPISQKATPTFLTADPRADFDWQTIGVGSSKPRVTAEPYRLLASRSHGGDELPGWLRRVIGDAKIIQRGSSLKFCSLAEREADLYVRMGPTSIWDTAAGQAILMASGGVVVNCETGAELTYSDPQKPLNPSFIAYLPERIKFSE